MWDAVNQIEIEIIKTCRTRIRYRMYHLIVIVPTRKKIEFIDVCRLHPNTQAINANTAQRRQIFTAVKVVGIGF